MQQTTDSVLAELSISLSNIHKHLESLAPENSSYVGLDNFKKSDYIYVNNKRVYTNSGKLKRSIATKTNMKGTTMVHDVYVSSSNVPYYNRAVLSPTLTRVVHYGRIEYGNTRYYNEVSWKSSKESVVPNRNYLYYQKGIDYIRAELGKYNGRKIEVSDDIGRWKDGI